MTNFDSIPVVNVSRLSEPASLRAIDQACRDWGFFQVVEHGIDPVLLATLQREMRAFFALPTEMKRRVVRTADNPWGFYDRELTKNARDWKEIFDCGPDNDPGQRTPWPKGSPRFRPALEAFMQSCEGLAFALLAAISTNLGMPAGHLGRAFHPAHTSFLRLNHYPLCPEPACPSDLRTPEAGHLGVNHHTDSGALTLLVQDEEPGLEVHHEGKWHLVEPRNDALVINIGDVVQVWSNDRYRAALHRVRASSERARFSAPYFFNPAHEATYAPLPATIPAGSFPHYRSIKWGEFRALRAAGDYQDCGEEIQIHHYRTPQAGSETERTTPFEEEDGHGLH
jgi:isopenicillin N synthase-like dioxygenase